MTEENLSKQQKQVELAILCQKFFKENGKFPPKEMKELWLSIYPFVLQYSSKKSSKVNFKTKDDLIQISYEALCKAVQKYQPSKMDNFFNYCVLWIKAYVRTENMKNISMFKYGSRKSRSLFNKLSKYSNLSREEQVQILGISREDIDAFVQATKVPKSILKKRKDGDSSEEEREEYLNSNIPDPEFLLCFKETLGQLDKSFEDFHLSLKDEREVKVFELLKKVGNPDKGKKFIENDGPQTYQDLATEFGISKEAVRQISSKIKKKLKRKLQNNGLNEKAYLSLYEKK